MTDHELLEQIKQSAQDIKAPESLAPESVAAKLTSPKTLKKPRHVSFRRTYSAAAVLLLFCLLSGAAWTTSHTGTKSNHTLNETARHTDAAVQTNNTAVKEVPKRNAGSLYTVAESYDDVYRHLRSTEISNISRNTVDFAADGNETAGAQKEMAVAETSLDTGSTKTAENTYSSTNLQTQGVDESDTTKTDGTYIYTVTDQKVCITDTSNAALTPAAAIDPDLGPSDSILELYIDGQTLLLLVEHYETSLEEATSEQTDSAVTGEIDSEVSSTGEVDPGFTSVDKCMKVNYMAAKSSTTLYTYDITDPKHPILTGSSTQDGFYYTSRKIGDIVYLFTQQTLVTPVPMDVQKTSLPRINGEDILYDHTYLSKAGQEGLIISSVNIRQPDTILDHLMILHNHAKIYVGPDSLYLYEWDYVNENSATQIAKFEIEDGNINAVNASSVQGEIYDTFAINEYEHTLRVLTTSYDTNGTPSNNLYLLDKDLLLTGTLQNIAPGEEIYAARYLGNIAYFITYENTDPLFAADLSDPDNPVLLGQLEITGFSEYLHFWGKDKLLGIGYETDPETGNRKGLKLVMFDISDSADLKTIDSLILKNYSFSSALYDYKCILADASKNMIGFTAEYDYITDDCYMDYNLFAWEDGHFVQKLKEPIRQEIISGTVRGLYINDIFYIANSLNVTSYDSKNGFQPLSQIDLTQ